MGGGREREAECPPLKGIPVDAEAVAARQRDEVGPLPIAVTLSDTPDNGLRLLFEPFGLQRAHPRMDRQLIQARNDLITGRIFVCLHQLLILCPDSSRHIDLHLGQRLATVSDDSTVGIAYDMQDHIVIARIAVVSVLVPVGGTAMNLHIAHPQHAVDLQLCIEEVGAGVIIVQTGVYHLDRPSVSSLQSLQRQQPVPPAIMQDKLGISFSFRHNLRIRISRAARMQDTGRNDNTACRRCLHRLSSIGYLPTLTLLLPQMASHTATVRSPAFPTAQKGPELSSAIYLQR